MRKEIAELLHKHALSIITAAVILVVALAANAVTARVLNAMAYAERGYAAVGGEWLAIIVLWVWEWYITVKGAQRFWSWFGGDKR